MEFYECTLCEKHQEFRAPDMDVMKRHVAICHFNSLLNRLVCTFCNEKFYDAEHLQEHTRNKFSKCRILKFTENKFGPNYLETMMANLENFTEKVSRRVWETVSSTHAAQRTKISNVVDARPCKLEPKDESEFPQTSVTGFQQASRYDIIDIADSPEPAATVDYVDISTGEESDLEIVKEILKDEDTKPLRSVQRDHRAASHASDDSEKGPTVVIETFDRRVEKCALCAEMGSNSPLCITERARIDHVIGHMKVCPKYVRKTKPYLLRTEHFERTMKICFVEGFYDEVIRKTADEVEDLDDEFTDEEEH